MKMLIWIIAVLAVLGAVLMFARIATGEDSWICKSGQWVKHGHPSSPIPEKGC